MKIVLRIICVTLTLMTISCVSQRRVPRSILHVEKAQPKMIEDLVPEWFLQPDSYRDQSYYWGVGEGNTMADAQLTALNDLISKIKIQISSSSTSNSYSRWVGRDEVISEHEYNQQINAQTKKLVLSQYDRVKVLVKQSTWYVLIRLNKQKYIESILQQEQNIYEQMTDNQSRAKASNSPIIQAKYFAKAAESCLALREYQIRSNLEPISSSECQAFIDQKNKETSNIAICVDLIRNDTKIWNDHDIRTQEIKSTLQTKIQSFGFDIGRSHHRGFSFLIPYNLLDFFGVLPRQNWLESDRPDQQKLLLSLTLTDIKPRGYYKVSLSVAEEDYKVFNYLSSTIQIPWDPTLGINKNEIVKKTVQFIEQNLTYDFFVNKS